MTRQTGTTVAALMLAGAAAVAEQQGPLLQVTGRIDGGTVNLDRTALEALPVTTLETTTVVTDGTHRFTGFLMRDLLDRLGVGVETIRSSQLKAAPSMLRELTPEGRAAEAALVQETHDWFRALVGERRALDGPDLDAVTNGRTFTGRMALDLGLVDALGDEQAALAYLESADSDLVDLPVETWAVEEEPAILDVILDSIGINTGGSRAYGLPQGPRLMAILK